MIPQPTIVKIVVPIPPVDGREEIFVFLISAPVVILFVHLPSEFAVKEATAVSSTFTPQVANVPLLL